MNGKRLLSLQILSGRSAFSKLERQMKKQVVIKEDGRKLIYYSFPNSQQKENGDAKNSRVEEERSQASATNSEKGN